jgi:mono/diheme cytochrome c family protein
MKKAVFLFILIFGVLSIGMAGFFWSGLYNVSATEPHWEVFRLLLEEIREQSVKAHSKGINPPSIEDAKLAEAGFPHFHEMCRLCHGAPGYPLPEFAQGLYPDPPALTSETVQKEWSNAQLFWIIKNGIKMTGMPAFGPTHDDKELWGVVAFLRRLPGMTDEEYNLWVQKTSSHHEHEHSHQHGEHEHSHNE